MKFHAKHAHFLAPAVVLFGVHLSEAVSQVDSDCDRNGAADRTEIVRRPGLDRNDNAVLDRCELGRGDLNLDCQVDFADLAVVLLNLGNPLPSPEDLNHDGLVDFGDVGIVLLSFGERSTENRARRLLIDALEGRSHLDIVIVGDSNATYSFAGSRGFAGGMTDALLGRGCVNYATGLIPAAASGTQPIYPRLGGRGMGRSPLGSVDVNDDPQSGGGWVRGSQTTPELDSLLRWDPDFPLYLDGQSIDWAFLPRSRASDVNGTDWIALPPASRDRQTLHSGIPGVFRVLTARLEAPAGSELRQPLELRVSSSLTPDRPHASLLLSTEHVGSPILVAGEVSYPAAPQGDMLTAAYFASDQGPTGPVATIFRSIHRADGAPGFAINVLQNWAGGTTSQIAASLGQNDGMPSPMTLTVLRELRMRQQSAGGPGRLLILVNMGVNNAAILGHADDVAMDCRRVVEILNDAWRTLGFPPEDLAFVVTASHNAGIVSYRPRVVNRVLREVLIGDARVCVLDLDAVAPVSFLSQNNLFEGDGSTPRAHLSNAGYLELADRILQRVLDGPTPPRTAAPVPDPLDTREDLAPLAR